MEGEAKCHILQLKAEFYAYEEELDWLDGKFPLTIETVKEMVVDRCDLPDGFKFNLINYS